MPELPMSIMRVGRAEIPFSGGGYMRFLPGAVIERGFDTFEKRGGPVVVYLHPRDFEPDCPRVPMPLKRRFKCYVGLKSTERKLRRLLEGRSFASCEQVLRGVGVPPMHERDSTSASSHGRASSGVSSS